MTTFFTSDLHLGHSNIIKHCNRPFGDVDAMNEAIIDNWNSVVTEDDHVYVLGDVAMKIQYVNELVPLLKGYKHLIPGNHDTCHPMHKGFRKQSLLYQIAGFQVHDTVEELTLRNRELLLGHFPWSHLSGEDARYPEWRPTRFEHQGYDMYLCGHVHEKWKYQPDGCCINVGVDQWDFTPVTIQQIFDYVREQDNGRS